MRWLEERGVGFDAMVARVPIVPAAVIFDLAEGNANVRPDSSMGYDACEQATSEAVEEGRVGAGAGATIGKALGMAMASAGGIGTASMKLAGGVTVGAIVVVNAFGDIIDPSNARVLAGARSPQGGWVNTQRLFESGAEETPTHTRKQSAGKSANDADTQHPFSALQNTTLAVVATDAALTKAQARKVAGMAHDGMARAIKPIHTMYDGDTIFALSTGSLPADVSIIGAVAAEVVARAIVRVGRMSARQKRNERR